MSLTCVWNTSLGDTGEIKPHIIVFQMALLASLGCASCGKG